jgi:hypothetical protein
MTLLKEEEILKQAVVVRKKQKDRREVVDDDVDRHYDEATPEIDEKIHSNNALLFCCLRDNKMH